MDKEVAFSNPISKGSYLLLVESKAPWYAPSFLIKQGFKRAVPEYKEIKGLKRKAFTIGRNNGFFGGLYTWQSLDDLKNYYNEERINSVEKKRGMRPILSIFQVLSSKDDVTTPSSKDIWEGNFIISIAEVKEVSESVALASFNESKLRDGVITDYLVLKEGLVYQISLWKDEKYLQKPALKTLDAPLIIENV